MSVHVDFLAVELEDCFGRNLQGGTVAKFSADGRVEWASSCRVMVEGSHSAQIAVRSMTPPDANPLDQWRDDYRAPSLMLSGNPVKFLNGHNLFGSDDVEGLLRDALNRVADKIGADPVPECHPLGDGAISRIDLTGHWLLDRADDVLPFLEAMADRAFLPYRGRGTYNTNEPGTLYFGFAGRNPVTGKKRRAPDAQIILYAKGRESDAHGLPGPCYHIPGLIDDLSRTIRVELRLRTAELKRLDMRFVRQWTPQRVREIWTEYVGRLDVGGATMDLESINYKALKPRVAAAIGAWRAGVNLRETMKKTAWYQLRRDVLDATGFDIKSAPPKSNVVPLIRYIQAQPASRPRWADHLDSVLMQVA